MGKIKAPRGMYRESVHDGSSVTASQLRSAPFDGLGRNTKSVDRRIRRHQFFSMVKTARKLGQRNAIPTILAIYRGHY